MFKKIANNTLAQIFSKVLTALISIVLLSLLTNYLSQEYFGVYSKMYNYLGIFAFLADLGLYTIMVREISRIPPNPPLLKEGITQTEKIVGNVLTLRTGLGLGIVVLALFIALFLPGYHSQIELIAVGIVGVFTVVSLMNSTFLAYMQSQLKMEFSLFSVVFGKLITIGGIALIIFALFPGNGGGVELLYIFLIGLVGIIVNTLLNYWYASKSCKITFRFDWEYIRYIFKISLPYGVALFLSVVYFKVDVILLSILETEKMADVSIALYSLPMKIVEVLMVVGGFYLNSILPKLTQLFESSDKKNSISETQNLLILSFKILFAFGILVFTFGLLFREYIIRIIGNESYIAPLNHVYNSSEAFVIVLGVLVFYFVSLLFIYIFIGVKKQGILLKINVVITLFNIIGNIILIPRYSFIGAGIVTLLSQIFLFIMSYYYSRKIVRFTFPKIFILKILLLSGILFCVFHILLSYFSMGLYIDVIFYGGMGVGIYSLLVFREMKNIGEGG